MRTHTTLLLLLALYGNVTSFAMGQDLNDATLNIDNRIDNQIQERQTQSQNNETAASPITLVRQSDVDAAKGIQRPFDTNPFDPVRGLKGGEFSGYTAQRKEGIYSTQFFLRNNFSENNSFVSKGVLDSFRTDAGLALKTDFGLTVQPYFTYKYGSQDLVGINNSYSNSYGGTLSFAQKVFPFVPLLGGQPGATYNLTTVDPASISKEELSNKAVKSIEGHPDVFPNFDIIVGSDFTFTHTNQMNLTKGQRLKNDQDSYDIIPNVAFEFNLSKNFSVSLVSAYPFDMASTDSGTSSSTGILQVQDRNTFTWKANDSDPTSDTYSVFESNSINHDTNIEPTALGATPVRYQNWASFGVGFGYAKVLSKDHVLLARISYSYDAFNNLYQAQSVTTSLNIDF